MKIWVICGAGRRVGKTHLALRLTEALPRAVYAKQGHGRPRAGKPANYFTTRAALDEFLRCCEGRYGHAVVESNALAREGRGDVIVFVGARPGQAGLRPDAERLRSRAHIRIDGSATARQWQRALRGRLPDRLLRRRVCEVLAGQSRHLFGAGLGVRSKVWFVAGGERVFGPGLARLLGAVERSGTLRAAAAEEGISYRHAWDEIRAAERRLGAPLLLRRAGGAGGGSSGLSPHGRRLLELFERLNRDVAAHADALFARYMREGADEATGTDDTA